MDEVSKASMSPLFRMFTLPAELGSPDIWIRNIQSSKVGIMNKREWTEENYPGVDIWKEYRAGKPYTEKRMVRHSAEVDRELLCVFSQPGTFSPIAVAKTLCKKSRNQQCVGESLT